MDMQLSTERIKQDCNDIIIFFVANVAGETNPIDYKNIENDILTEFFTEDEYNSMLNALKDNFNRIKVFFNEDDFILYILNNESNINKEKLVVFNLARNGIGLNKKSLIPSFCDLHNLKYTGSAAYATCLGRHKFHYNSLLRDNNISVVDSWVYTANGWLQDNSPEIGTRVIIKPMFESASRGISKESILTFNDTQEFYSIAKKVISDFEQDIIVQRFISGYEVQVPVVFYKIFTSLSPVGISIDNNKRIEDSIISYDMAFDETYSFYDYESIDKDLSKKLMKESSNAAIIMGIGSYGRFDFRIDNHGNYYITDVSTHPYLIHHSAFYHRFNQLGYSFSDMFLFLIWLTLEK